VVLDGFVRALDGFEAVVAGVPADRWDAPSPCEGWSAVDVAGHVIGNLRAVEAFATGSQEAADPAAPRSVAGDDPLAAWRSAREDMMAVLEPRALARGVPEAQDDRRYGFALAAACMSWALLRLHRFAVLDTRAPGDHSRLQLVETLESAARTAEAHRALPHLAGWARRTADVLRRRWPDADLDLTDWARFPPYSPRR